MKKGDFLWSAYRITEKQKAGKARNIKEKQLKNSRSPASKPLVARLSSASAEFISSTSTHSGGCLFFCPKTRGRAAAHTGAALQGNYSVCVGAALPRPWAPHFHKTVIPRSAATWESVFPMRECGARRIRIAAPAGRLVRNDRDFGKGCRWRGRRFFIKQARPQDGFPLAGGLSLLFLIFSQPEQSFYPW